MFLHEWRDQNNLTKEEAGRRIGVSGVSIGRYEAGRVPDSRTLRLIMDATENQVTPNDFFPPTGRDTSAAYRGGQSGYRAKSPRKSRASRSRKVKQ